ncbi:hypothetical protein CVN56_26915 [Rhodococcus sp. AQ5-07]|nr:hypothetical protein CVN56_26915 [Rhodococcus sp. AQ5-07]
MTIHGIRLDADTRFKVKIAALATAVLLIGLLGVFANSIGGLSWDYAHTASGQPLFQRYSFIAGIIIVSMWVVAAGSSLFVWCRNRKARTSLEA